MDISIGHKILYYLTEADRLVKGLFQEPVTCEIDASNKCQNNCNFCIYADYIKKERVHLDWNVYVNLIYSLVRWNIKSVTFTGGGEPLMNPDIENMIVCANDMGLKVGLVTNGIKLDSITHYERFEFIRVSLDCASPETYRDIKGTNYFYTVIENIERVVASGETDVGISMVIVKENRDEIETFKELGKSLGVNYVQVKPAWIEANIENTTRGIKDKGLFVTERYTVNPESMLACKLAGLVGQVGADGKMYYCCVHRGKKEFEIGDLRKTPFSKIINGRDSFHPDLSVCGSCRYMNYAKIYQKVIDKKFTPLRHREFL